MKSLLKSSSALVAVAFLLQPVVATPAAAASSIVTLQPNLADPVNSYATNPATDSPLSYARDDRTHQNEDQIRVCDLQREQLVRPRVWHFPGRQRAVLGRPEPPRPRRTRQASSDLYRRQRRVHEVSRSGWDRSRTRRSCDSTDHSHTGLAAKLDVLNGVPQMDGLRQDEYTATSGYGRNPGTAATQPKARNTPTRDGARRLRHHPVLLAVRQPLHHLRQHLRHRRHALVAERDRDDRRQSGEIAVGRAPDRGQDVHADGDLLPARSTARPKTAAARRRRRAYRSSTTRNLGGVLFRRYDHQSPASQRNENWTPTNTSVNLTFANVLLTLGGNNVTTLMAGDKQRRDRSGRHRRRTSPTSRRTRPGSFAWRWYQNGYDAEPRAPANPTPAANYVSHHNGAQYFGYISNNPMNRRT